MAEAVTDIIRAAVTDGTHQLRYRVGVDAKMILTRQKAVDDTTFIGGYCASSYKRISVESSSFPQDILPPTTTAFIYCSFLIRRHMSVRPFRPPFGFSDRNFKTFANAIRRVLQSVEP